MYNNYDWEDFIMVKENAAMSGVMTKKKNTETKTEETQQLKKLTSEDLIYLKTLNDKTREIKALIGELEVSKMRLLGDFNVAVGRESDFVSQMYIKYDIPEDKDFSINPDTGEIKMQE